MLDEFFDLLTHYDHLYVGFSGGLDSTVLLHALSQCPIISNKISAIHINHGLSPNALKWEKHCENFCKTLKIPFILKKVQVLIKNNIEEKARKERYLIFQSFLKKNDCLLLGHHRDDQAETLLLHLFRGAGVDGLAAMSFIKPLNAGFLLRPFLNHSRNDLQCYAEKHKLFWVDDESNMDSFYSRNFIRHHVIPLITTRWPQLVNNLLRTSTHCQEAKSNLEQLAYIDCPNLDVIKGQLPLRSLNSLTDNRLHNVLRTWLTLNQIKMPNTVTFNRLIKEVVYAKKDAKPEVQWGNVSVSRYNEKLYLKCLEETSHDVISRLNAIEKTSERSPDSFAGSKDLAADPTNKSRCVGSEKKGMIPISRQRQISWSNFPNELCLGERGLLKVEQNGHLKIPPRAVIEIRFRQGGEHFVWHGQTKQLKKLFQDWKIPPWERDQVPLLFVNNQLAAVIGYAINDNFYDDSKTGFVISYWGDFDVTQNGHM